MSDPIQFTATMKGGSDVARLLNRYPEKVGRTLESLVKQEARGLAVELARNTRPHGFSEKARKRGEKAVAGDIHSVFATPEQAYETAKAADMTQADRFWANIQNRRFARARKALSESTSKWSHLPVGRLDPKLHQASRTGPHANVVRREPAQIVTSNKALLNYIARIQKRVGFAKGTWIKAAKAMFLNVDLSEVAANDAQLPQARLTNCKCVGACLGGADLRQVTFTKVVLDGSDLSGAKLDDATFVESSLVQTDFGAETTAQRVNLEDCDLTGLRASEGVDFTRANFRGATAPKSRFQNAMLHFANFSMADLDDADFSDANLAQATLLGCKLRMARFDRSTAVGAVFGKSDLHQAKFEKANLHHADLRGCNLYQAEFLDAETQDAQLELAILTGTKLA